MEPRRREEGRRDEGPWEPVRGPAPLNPIPPVVAALALVIAGIEVVLSLADRGLAGGAAGIGWRLAAIQDWGAFDQILAAMRARGDWPPGQLMRLVTYPFVHLSLTHALFVVVFLLALGKMVGEAFGQAATLAVFFLSGAIGALAWSILADDPFPLVGGYPAVYGLIGAFTWLLWTGLGAAGASRMRAFTLIGMLLGLQLVFGLLFGGGLGWIAEVAGFAAGFGFSFLLGPGGWRRSLERLRRR